MFGLYLISVGWSDWFGLTRVVHELRFPPRQELQDRLVSPPDFPLLLNPSTACHKVSSPTHCYTEATTPSRSCLVLQDRPLRSTSSSPVFETDVSRNVETLKRSTGNIRLKHQTPFLLVHIILEPYLEIGLSSQSRTDDGWWSRTTREPRPFVVNLYK